MSWTDLDETIVDRQAGHLDDHDAIHAYLNHRHDVVYDVTDYGAVGDGTADDTTAIQATLAAAYTGAGGYAIVFFPAGRYRFTSQLTFGTNVTVVGDGSRPYNQGGSELYFDGTLASNEAAVVAGAGGTDWSNCSLRSFRITSSGGLSDGWGLRVHNPTNSTSVEDVLVSGFPEGACHITSTDTGTGGSGNPGPNFFRISRAFFVGGVYPLKISQGRQTMLVEYMGIDADSTTTACMLMEGGEGQAFIATFVGCKFELPAGVDTVGVKVAGLHETLFVGCTVYSNDANASSAAWLYDNPAQPDMAMNLIGCTTLNFDTAVSAPDRGVTIPGGGTIGRIIPAVIVAGRGTSLIPFSNSADFNRTLHLHNDIMLGWSSDGNPLNVDTNLYRTAADTLKTDDSLTVGAGLNVVGDLNHDGTNVGFYGTAPVAQQTGVAVSAAGIHAALVALGLITA